MSSTNSPIDFSRYRSSELFESIKKVCSFPSAAAFNISALPIICVVLSAIVSVVLMLKVSAVAGIMLLLFSFTIVPIWAFVLGMWRTSSRLVEDTSHLLALALQTTENIGRDIQAQNMDSALSSAQPKQILTAVNKSVILPLLVQYLAEKIPFVGGRLATRATAALDAMTENLSADSSAATADNGSSPISQRLIDFSKNAQQRVDNILQKTSSRLVAPMRVSFIVVSVVLLVLLAAVAFISMR